MYNDPLDKIYNDLYEHTMHLLEEHDLPVEAVAGSLMAIAMRLYKTSLSEENFNKIKGKIYLNKKTFPYGKKINFNSLRKGEIIGQHQVLFSTGKETITLDHEAFDRSLYSEGALTAAKWLSNKKPGLYSMRNVLNF